MSAIEECLYEAAAHCPQTAERAFEALDALKARIAELESALALATEAVAAEARAKVEGLTCTREERAVLDACKELTVCAARDVDIGDDTMSRIAKAELARREAAKTKGDGNG